MSSLPEDARPKPSRIVIHFDRARQLAHVPPRGSRGAKILGVIVILLLVIGIGAGVGGYFWWQSYKTKPAYSLALLVDAVQRNDMAAFDQIVNTDKVVDNFVPQVTEKAAGRYAATLTEPLRAQVEKLIPTLLPGVKTEVREEVTKEVKELSERATGKPFVIVALGIPYVVDIKQDNDTARVVVNLKDRPIELRMQRVDNLWQVVEVKDDTIATRIVDNIAKDLPAVGSQIEREVRKKLKKNLPSGLPNIPLLNDEDKK